MPIGTHMTKRQLDRLAEKYHRLAYEFEHDAHRVRTSWHPSYAETIKSISRQLGDLARTIEAEIT
jgi:hypothetical protein